MKSCESVNCNSCGGNVKLYSRDYGNCEYCGNTNKVLSDGKTVILKRETKIEEPQPKSKMNVIFFVLGILLVGAVVFYFAKRKKLTNGIG